MFCVLVSSTTGAQRDFHDSSAFLGRLSPYLLESFSLRAKTPFRMVHFQISSICASGLVGSCFE